MLKSEKRNVDHNRRSNGRRTIEDVVVVCMIVIYVLGRVSSTKPSEELEV